MTSTSAPTTTRTRRRRVGRAGRVAAGVAAGAVLALGIPLAASAHVEVTPTEASAGATTRLTFGFHHGCDGSPTTSLVVDIPDDVANAMPVVDAAWTIQRQLRADGTPSQITFTAVTPVESGLSASVSMDTLFADGAADSSVALPVTQNCVAGSTAWTQIAKDGEDPESLENPAPVVAVGAVAADAEGHDHGDADGDHAAATATPDAEEVHTATASEGDPVARWLAGGALVAGIAALVVALVRRRAPKD